MMAHQKLAGAFSIGLLFLLTQSRASRAQQVPTECERLVKSLPAPGDPRLDERVKSLIQAGSQITCVWQLAAASGRINPVITKDDVIAALKRAYQAQKSVNTTQTGAATGSSGSTSAVSKPSTPLSIATEYGGITSSTTGETMTFQTPLDGIPRALVTHGDIPYCDTPLLSRLPGCVSRAVLDKLDRIGIGVSVNTSGSKNVSGTATGPGQGTTQQASLSSVGSKIPSFAGTFLKVAIIRAGSDKLPDPSTIKSESLMKSFGAVVSEVTTLPGYVDWQKCVRSKLMAAGASERDAVFVKYYTQIVDIILAGANVDCSANPAAVRLPEQSMLTDADRKVVQDMEDFLASSEIVGAQFEEAVNEAASAPVLSFEYDYSTPQNQPTNSTIKVVGSVSFLKKKGQEASEGKAKGSGSDSSVPTAPLTLTYNAGFSLYNYTPASSIPGSSLLRDVQVGTELDYNISSSHWPGVLKKIGDSTASGTYYFQYQSSPSILNVTPGSPLNGITITGLPATATQVFAKKGDIHVAQLKWGLGKGKNVKFPIAVTYSNRTELITHPAWGLQFGASYDLSAFMGTGSSK
jgi:hypothetical protein